MSNHTQEDVLKWVRRTFGTEFINDRERTLRFIEEALELAQAMGPSTEDIANIFAHVYARPVGNALAEIGGVYITLEALAEYLDVNLIEQSDREWERVNRLPQSHFDAASERKKEAGVSHFSPDDP